MARRRMLVAVVAVVLGGLTATGAAYAGEREPARGNALGVDHRMFCERLEHRIQHVRAKIGKLEALADRIEAKLASGELTPEQEKRARHALAHIADALERLEAKLRKLLEVYEARCT
jgi:methyl-accepting chemotaxis protein